jgi:ribose-phosphate pyrophosphokinase
VSSNGRAASGMPLARSEVMSLSVIAGSANIPLATSVADALSVPLCTTRIRRFPDSELHVEIDETVRGHDIYVVQPTSPPVDEHVMELLFLADACRRAGASRLTAVVPYFGYARQDRRATGRGAVGAHVIARLLEAAGFARVVSVDLHAPAIEGFFHIPFEHLSAAPLLAPAVRITSHSIIVAPDLGAVKLAQRYQAELQLPIVVLHKSRLNGSSVSLAGVIGEVRNCSPIIVDDMITTGGTIEAAIKGLLEAGSTPDIAVVATHALFVGPALGRLHALPIRQLVGTNSVDPETLPAHFQTVNLAPTLADMIARLHGDKSLDDLLVHA